MVNSRIGMAANKDLSAREAIRKAILKGLFERADVDYHSQIFHILMQHGDYDAFLYRGKFYPDIAIRFNPIALKNCFHEKVNKLISNRETIEERMAFITNYIRVLLNLCNTYEDIKLLLPESLMQFVSPKYIIGDRTTLTDRDLHLFHKANHGGEAAVREFQLETMLMFS